MSTKTEGDLKYVVVENGQRIGKSVDTRDQAEREADKLKKLTEAAGSPNVTVKQNLFG